MSEVINDRDRNFRIRGLLVAGAGCFAMLCLVGRLFYWQVMRNTELLDKAKRNYVVKNTLHGRRGQIYDSNGYLLVGNMPCMNITASPANLNAKQREEVSYILARHLGTDRSEMFSKLAPTRIKEDKGTGTSRQVPNMHVVLAKQINFQEATTLRDELRAAGINSNTISFSGTSKRVYPKGQLLNTMLGFVNIDQDRDVPQAGIEKKLENDIKETAGYEKYLRSRDGKPMDNAEKLMQAGKDGKNVFLTISEPIQGILEEEIEKAFVQFSPDTLYAIVVEPKTGKVLAVAQRPTYKTDDRSTYANQYNHIVGDAFEPGSVIKPIIVSEALDRGMVKPNDKFYCEKGHWKEEKLHDTHKYEHLTVTEIIQKSSNIGTVKIGLSMGEDAIYSTLRKFGCGVKTGIQIPAESSGRLVKPKHHDRFFPGRLCFGHGSQWTVLQLARAYCGIANRGHMPMKLSIVDHLEDAETGERIEMPANSYRTLFKSPNTADDIISMMIKVTEPGGTAPRARIPGFTVAGKTGTADHPRQNAVTSSFVGFAPARDPKFLMLITMNNPKTRPRTAGYVCGPTFSAVGQKILQLYNVPPEEPVSK